MVAAGKPRRRFLRYWCCQRLDDSAAYNIRERTKRAANQKRKKMPESYGKPFRVIVRYADAFDLACQLLGEAPPEGGGRLDAEDT